MLPRDWQVHQRVQVQLRVDVVDVQQQPGQVDETINNAGP